MSLKEIVISNWDGEKFIDRLYQSFDKSLYMIQTDGSRYSGAIKTIFVRGEYGTTKVSFSEDGRWFNSSGLPIKKPDHVDEKSEINKLKSELKKLEAEAKFKALKLKITKGR